MGCTSQFGRELPRYKCHKEVQALKIAAIEPEQMPTFHGAICKGSLSLGSACGNCARCQWERSHPQAMGVIITPAEDGYVPFLVSRDYVTKHQPQVGGYFVLYADAYQSYSPAKAFEEGYTRI